MVVIEQILGENEKKILEQWVKNQLDVVSSHKILISNEQIKKNSADFLKMLVKAIANGLFEDLSTSNMEGIVSYIKNFSRERAKIGFTPSETAQYIFGLKAAIFSFLTEHYRNDLEKIFDEMIKINDFLDKLGLISFDEYVKGRDQVIKEQAETLLELSTPIVSIWHKVLTIPIVGTLDSKRTQMIMENLLQKIVDTGTKIAIVDITGVAIVDTQVANHIIKTINAVKLLGSEAIITGISPEVAQTIVNLGVDLGDVVTKASLAEGLLYALKELNYKISLGS